MANVLQTVNPPPQPSFVESAGVTMQTSSLTFTVSCLCGDLDGDGQVDLADFVTFSGCFGLTAPTENCSAQELFCSDLNGDGDVNLADFVTFAPLFGQPGSGFPPNCLP